MIKNLSMKESDMAWFRMMEIGLLLICFLLMWPLGQGFISRNDPTAGYVDPSIWLLVLLSLIAFLLAVLISMWLLQRVWMAIGLPKFSSMVLQFTTLALWQQLGFYWVSFALLLFAVVGCLSAIC